jgi:hypothetical protein
MSIQLFNGDCLAEMAKLEAESVACVLTDRSFIGIELDEKYFGIANQRIADAEIERKERLF